MDGAKFKPLSLHCLISRMAFTKVMYLHGLQDSGRCKTGNVRCHCGRADRMTYCHQHFYDQRGFS